MKLIKAAVLTVVGLFGATGVSADLSTDTVRDISIERASATKLANGEIRIRFTLSNDSPEPVTVMGISSPVALSGEIVGDSHHGEEFRVGGLILRPDEEMNFSTSHLEARLSGVDAAAGAIVFQVLLGDGAVSGEAHVH